MSTASQRAITAVIGGQPLGIFDSRTGGETTAEVPKRRQGAMQGEKAYAAFRTHADVTVVRGYERERDHELIRELRRQVGSAPMTVTDQPLDDDGVAWGTPVVYIGRLSGLTPADADAESNDPATFELTMVTTEVV